MESALQQRYEDIGILISEDRVIRAKEIARFRPGPAPGLGPGGKKLLGKSPVDLTGKAEKPFTIAGNVRVGTAASDPFVAKLQTISGQALAGRQYELRVKKR